MLFFFSLALLLFQSRPARSRMTSMMAGWVPIGGRISNDIPSCMPTASSVNCGMSVVACRPGERKNGTTITCVISDAAQLSTASAMFGVANSMCAGKTGTVDLARILSAISKTRSFAACRFDPWSTTIMAVRFSSLRFEDVPEVLCSVGVVRMLHRVADSRVGLSSLVRVLPVSELVALPIRMPLV